MHQNGQDTKDGFSKPIFFIKESGGGVIFFHSEPTPNKQSKLGAKGIL